MNDRPCSPSASSAQPHAQCRCSPSPSRKLRIGGGTLDGQRFDRIVRACSASTSRRQFARILATAMLATLPNRRVSAMQGQEYPQGESCEPGLTFCEEVSGCVDLLTDLNSCGACGNTCRSDLVAVECRNGECVRADCPVGLEYCGAADLCRDLNTDPAHCGACGYVCASGVCNAGVCQRANEDVGCIPGETDCGGCRSDQTLCDGVCIETCCDNNNCGACGNVCAAPLTCFEGECSCPSEGCCAEGETLCDGVCVDTCCDNNNCGECGKVCPGGLTCFEGVCDCLSSQCCAEGEILCGDTCVATRCDNDNCGACGNVCTGGRTCVEGTCSCSSGLCLPKTGHGSTRTVFGRSVWQYPAFAAIASALTATWYAYRSRHAPRASVTFADGHRDQPQRTIDFRSRRDEE